jgi:hypothetical protein
MGMGSSTQGDGPLAGGTPITAGYQSNNRSQRTFGQPSVANPPADGR